MRFFTKNTAVMILVFFVSLAGHATAQITLTGKIADDQNKPIAYAMVSLYAAGAENTALIEKLTDEDGVFLIPVPHYGTFTLRAHSMSHTDMSQVIEINAPQTAIAMVMKQKEISLGEVTVLARENMIKHELGKTIMTVEGNEFLVGKSSLELLQMAPGVLVLNDQVKLNGLTDAKVMLNDKLLNLTGADLLNFLGSLRSENIQSVEIIKHPPAEYEASIGGLIHIIYRNPKEQGLIGSVSGGYTQGRYGSFNNGATLHYKKGNLRLSGSLSYDQPKEFFDTKQERRMNGLVTYNAVDTGMIDKKVTNTRLGAFIDFSPAQSAGIEYMHYENDNSTVINSLIDLRNVETANAFRLKGNYPRSLQTSYDNVGIHYEHTLDTLGSTITFLSDFTQNKDSFKNNAKSLYTHQESGAEQDSIYRNTGSSKSDIFTVSLQVNKGFRNDLKLSSGFKYSQSSIGNNIVFDYLQDRWVNVTGLSNAFEYSEKIIASYFKLEGKVFNVEYDLGLRGEQTFSEGYSLTLKQQNQQAYFNLFPNVNLKRYTNEEKGNYFTFSYSKHINRPHYSYLNPFVNYTNDFTTYTGNPYLNPEIDNSVDLSFYLQDTYSISVAYSDMRNGIQQVPIPNLENSSINTLWINSQHMKSYSLSLSVPYQVAEWWSSYTNISGIYQEYGFEGLENNLPFAYVQSQQQIQIPKGYNVSVTGLYVSKFNQGVSVMQDFYQLNIGVQKRFMRNKLSARLQVNDVLNSWRLHSDTSFKGLETSIRAKKQTQTVSLQLQYNFSLGKSFNAKKVERSSAEEKGRL
ncbi:outer membrane beta-barrel protein [Pontibacter silvestris]|uniref:Outer membrane beta-barrel protein n=1 Tax=Pontibacter silvestris TaxID=2305183 RepID=A0ABW4WZT3_9BACT|nr:outer membrane beta-barrel family protein [Pontibacter silvestris]MCC9138812.1 TonB-dependent receptor [Pontibacter silvestris]